MMISVCAARSDPASVGLKSFSMGIGSDEKCRRHTWSNRRVVYSYSPTFHSPSVTRGKWYLQEGTTSTENGDATASALSKNSRYFANVSYQPRPFQETVQPGVPSLPV